MDRLCEKDPGVHGPNRNSKSKVELIVENPLRKEVVEGLFGDRDIVYGVNSPVQSRSSIKV